MMDSCCQDKVSELDQLRTHQAHVLWIVLLINGLMFCLECVVGLLAGSVALQADSLDMLGDTLVYGFSLYTLTKSERWRASAAVLKGGIMLVFGLGVLAETAHILTENVVPVAPSMGIMSGVALVANLLCMMLLTRHKSDDLNMRSTWLCSRNDIVANTSVLVAAGLVALLHTRWPDVIVGVVITGMFLQSAVSILRAAVAELRTTTAVPVPEMRCPAGTCPANACQCTG